MRRGLSFNVLSGIRRWFSLNVKLYTIICIRRPRGFCFNLFQTGYLCFSTLSSISTSGWSATVTPSFTLILLDNSTNPFITSLIPKGLASLSQLRSNAEVTQKISKFEYNAKRGDRRPLIPMIIPI